MKLPQESDTQRAAVAHQRLVQPSDVAQKMKESVQLGAQMVNILDFRNAHMEGRIRFYLECAEGKHQAVDLAECIREDLRRLESDRADSYGLNSQDLPRA